MQLSLCMNYPISMLTGYFPPLSDTVSVLFTTVLLAWCRAHQKKVTDTLPGGLGETSIDPFDRQADRGRQTEAQRGCMASSQSQQPTSWPQGLGLWPLFPHLWGQMVMI